MCRLGRFVLGGVVVLPRDQVVVRIEARAEGAGDGGTIIVLLHVLFAAPDGLHRHVELLRDARRLIDGVGGVRQTAAEASAQIEHVHGHVVLIQPGYRSDAATNAQVVLRARPDIGLAIVEMHGAVHRLHRRVRQIRHTVSGVDGGRGASQCCRRIAFFHILVQFALQCGVELGIDRLCGDLIICGCLEPNIERG